jgi:hypothetical protein
MAGVYSWPHQRRGKHGRLGSTTPDK